MNIQPYIVLNNKDSRQIKGLLVSALAPISKPQVRTQVETVDGRDGDIVTPLGFAAYDKVITIGLTYGYNVDDIIDYFNFNNINCVISLKIIFNFYLAREKINV